MGKWKSLDKYSKINKSLDIIGMILVISLVVMTFIYWGKAPEVVPTEPVNNFVYSKFPLGNNE